MSHHHHEVTNHNKAFAIGIVLNIIFVVIEAAYGILSDSLALIADAGHNLSDVFSLLLAWGASYLASRAATEKRTYGLRKAPVLASLGSAILLLIALGGIAWEAVSRFDTPAPAEGVTMIVVAAIGVVINALTAWLFFSGQKTDLNIKGAFLHMAADAVVSLGVVLAGVLILWQGWLWVDPVISLLIVVAILLGTLRLLKDSMNYALDAVPNSVDIAALRQYITGLESVERIHDLHVWPLSTTEIALTVHLVVNDTQLDNHFLRQLQQHFHDHFNIAHATIQIESSWDEQRCMLDHSQQRAAAH
ncbi:cation diffusion facilitator family transporter [Amphritea sp. 1_MG-2023]|uniref:cation diffusion facilitator family transporter n=1 Tax=Amphritea sp. 1_MG-2023 TaxID=3062670 RepID=UPI0026E376DB|nr:cation diffusion facilitator family transporter [Amphritea sp. 1_MG-2023]MDO6563114.1 cation diffusion facilitator family transporter [Amphritea sp. 1_MG-2023]